MMYHDEDDTRQIKRPSNIEELCDQVHRNSLVLARMRKQFRRLEARMTAAAFVGAAVAEGVVRMVTQ